MPGEELKRNSDSTLEVGYTNKDYTPITLHILAGLLKNSCFCFLQNNRKQKSGKKVVSQETLIESSGELFARQKKQSGTNKC